MCNAGACDPSGRDSIRHCPMGHILTFTIKDSGAIVSACT